jgi:hypothetical protein
MTGIEIAITLFFDVHMYVGKSHGELSGVHLCDLSRDWVTRRWAVIPETRHTSAQNPPNGLSYVDT